MISKQQLILIHTAKRAIEKINPNFDDAQYRTVLRSIAHVESSKDLDNKTFEQVMAWFESVGFRQTQRDTNSHRSEPGPIEPCEAKTSPVPSEIGENHPKSVDQISGYWQQKATRHARYASDRELRMIEQLQTQSPYPLPSMVRRLSGGRTDQATQLYLKESYALIEALKKIVQREELSLRRAAKNAENANPADPLCVSAPLRETTLSESELSQIKKDVLPE